MSLPRKRDRPRTTGTRGDWDITSKAPAKKAKAGPKPRKAMARGKPLDRGEGPKRTSKLNQVSAKTVARRPDRAAVRKARCALSHLGPCAGPVDTHEIVRRSQMAEAAYMDDVTIGACRKHHGLDEYRLTGERIGIRIPRAVYDQDPARAVAEATRLRACAPSGVPYWWSDQDHAGWDADAGNRLAEIRR